MLDFLFPRRCPVCKNRLIGESCICTTCMGNLPRTFYHTQTGNRLEQRFYGTVPIERATAYFFYSPESPYHTILHQLKYYKDKKMGIYMGRCMATHLKHGRYNFFEGIDLIIPVPLSSVRMRQRGYNQSELLAEGIKSETGLPIETGVVIRTTDNPTQTHLNDIERWENVKGIFKATPEASQKLNNKHILLIDDVTTTGATLTSCALAIKETAPECRISIATLCMTTDI